MKVKDVIRMDGWNQVPTVKWADLGKKNQDWVLEQWNKYLDSFDPNDVDIVAVGMDESARDYFYEDHPNWDDNKDGYAEDSESWKKYEREAAQSYLESIKEDPFSMGVEDWWNNGCFSFSTNYYGRKSLFESYEDYGESYFDGHKYGTGHHQEGHLSYDDSFGPETYFVVEGKVTDSNCAAIYHAWKDNGEANYIHFVDYAKAGAKTAFDKVTSCGCWAYGDKPRQSHSRIAGGATLEVMKDIYSDNVIGSYNTGVTVTKKKASKPAPKTPNVDVINQSIVDKVMGMADGTYGDVVIYTTINGNKCIRNKKDTYHYRIGNISDDYKWDGKNFTNSTNHYLKRTYASMLLKAYNA